MRSYYYTYILLDPRKPGEFFYDEIHLAFEPFYVGFGSKNRAYDHAKLAKLDICSNKHKFNKIKKILALGMEPIVHFHRKNLIKSEAKENEIYLIEKIGRTFDIKGPLTNKTKGGNCFPDSCYDFNVRKHPNLGKKWTEFSKNKLSESRMGMKFTESHRKNLSRPKSFEHKLRISATNASSKGVEVYDSNGNFLNYFMSVSLAASHYNLKAGIIYSRMRRREFYGDYFFIRPETFVRINYGNINN